MHPARRHPHPSPPPARLAPVGSPAYKTVVPVTCSRCGGEGFVDELVRVKCRACNSAGSFEVRYVAARPEWHALYADNPLGFGGYFCLAFDAEERTLGWAQTEEQAQCEPREWHWWPIQEHAPIMAALGVGWPR